MNAHLDEILDIYEAAASQGRLRKRRNDDLLFPFCVLPSFDSCPLYLCYGPQIKQRPLHLIGHFLHEGKTNTTLISKELEKNLYTSTPIQAYLYKTSQDIGCVFS